MRSKPCHLLLELSQTIKYILYSLYNEDIRTLVAGPQVTRSLHSKVSISTPDGCCQSKLHPCESFTAEFRLFSYLRKSPHFSHLITQTEDLVFKKKPFCFVINLSAGKAWNLTVQMHTHVQTGTQLGKFNWVTGVDNQKEVATGKPETSCYGEVCRFSSCLGNSHAEIRMSLPTDFSNIAQESQSLLQSASEVFNSRNNSMPLFKEVTAGDETQIKRVWSPQPA